MEGFHQHQLVTRTLRSAGSRARAARRRPPPAAEPGASTHPRRTPTAPTLAQPPGIQPHATPAAAADVEERVVGTR